MDNKFTVTDEESKVIRDGLVMNLEYYLNCTDNDNEGFGPCGGYHAEIDGMLMTLKVLKIPEYEQYAELWEQRKKEYNIAITAN